MNEYSADTNNLDNFMLTKKMSIYIIVVVVIVVILTSIHPSIQFVLFHQIGICGTDPR